MDTIKFMIAKMIFATLPFAAIHSAYSADSNMQPPSKSTMKETYKNKIVLIVNGDDAGVTAIFTDATLNAFLKGGISSASVVATGHDVDRAIKLFKEHPELPVGVHLTLTGDWKPLTPGKSLCAANGLMYNTAEEAGRKVVPAEAEAEWDAQIKKIIDNGLEVSHIDSHMFCYFQSRELFGAALKLAKKYKIPLIAPEMHDWIPASERNLFALSSYSGIYRLEKGKETPENRTAAYWKKFAGLNPGIHYLYTHQGFMPSDNNITGDLDLRIDETKFWVNDETKKELAGKGIVVIGCKPLKEDFQKALSIDK